MSIPQHFQKFKAKYPELASAYENLGDAVHKAGPLDVKTRCLVKLAVSCGTGSEGAVHSQVRKALEAGVTPGEITHAVLLSFPTIGFPAMMAALSWANDILDAE